MQSESKLIAEYRDLVKEGRERFKKELESIMPDVYIPKRVGMFMFTILLCHYL